MAGTGSVWSNTANLTVGASGTGNRLTVSNSATVYSAGGIIGDAAASANNLATITGSGSTWNNSGNLTVGNNGTGNSLTISNGATVSNGNGTIGAQADGNSVTVAGGNSQWVNTGNLVVGSSGSTGHGNQLIITSAGAVAAVNLYVGFNPNSIGNIVTVNSGYLTVTNAGAAVVDVRCGTLALSNGGSITTDKLLLTNGASSVFSFNGGTLTSGSTMETNGVAFVIGDTAGNSYFIGTGGAQNFANHVIIGNGATANSNSLLLTNGAALRALGETIFVGAGGSGNQLTIATNSSAVVDSVIVGRLSISTGNSLLVAGGRLTATNATGTGVVDVRHGAIALSNGGSITTDKLLLTNGASSVFSFNGGTLTSGSTMETNGVAFVIGDTAGNSYFIGTGGAQNFANHVIIGNGATANSNSLLLTNGAALRALGETIFVGAGGSGNQLTVATNSSAVADAVIVGSLSTSTGNSLLVAGGRLTTTNATQTGIMDVRHGTLTLSNGGSITTDKLLITNTAGVLVFNSGTLSTSSSYISNNLTAVIGTGLSSAQWNMHDGLQSLAVGLTVFGRAIVNVTSAQLSVSGQVTNNGTLNFVNSVGSFNQQVVNANAWFTDPTTNIFYDNFIQTESSYIHAAADDVYIFTNNATTAGGFLNRSTNNVPWDTSQTKFVFAATLSVTQNFYAAGHERLDLLTAGVHTDQTTQVTGDWTASTNINFSLGTLEISAYSTVRVWDVFSDLGPQFGTNDNWRGALYVENLELGIGSYLIISSNTSVYFLNSNTWSSANFELLGGGFRTGGELHQFAPLSPAVQVVPEPEVLLLWGIGAMIVFVARRRGGKNASPKLKL